MSRMPTHKYRPFPPMRLDDRQWPSQSITRAPRWCSVDLRDGNQALVEPMGIERKRRLFDLLVRMGFKEIEVGFPSASRTEFDFVRMLIEERLIPDDVTVQVLTQAREDLIDRTFESLAGVPRAIVHVYNATAPLFRRVVFGQDEDGVVEIAKRATERIKQRARALSGSDVRLEYSPEIFSATEPAFAVRICTAVMNVWEPTPDKRIILNLPATVEVATPNVYADQVEWFIRNLPRRECAEISLHTHNDRGTAVAAAELALMAGGDRVEGTLFGNGERTGNVDIVTLALNLHSQGVDPELDLSDVPLIVRTTEYCTQLPVHARHPYAGELVFTAFSGSHQDAIKKGFTAYEKSDGDAWEMPYLPIDPKDIGCTYEAVIRVNSQSGKGGIAYVLRADHGLDLPRGLQMEFSGVIQRRVEESGSEITSREIWSTFCSEYFFEDEKAPLRMSGHKTHDEIDRNELDETVVLYSDIPLLQEAWQGESIALSGKGNGPIDAFIDGLRRASGIDISVRDYHEHAVGRGENAAAVAYVEILTGNQAFYGVGRNANIVTASLQAICSAVSRAARDGKLKRSDAKGEANAAVAV